MYMADEARKESVKRNRQRVLQKWNLLDIMQLAWFEFRIKLAAKRGKRGIYSWLKVRPNVFRELDEVGDYSVVDSTFLEKSHIFW